MHLTTSRDGKTNISKYCAFPEIDILQQLPIFLRDFLLPHAISVKFQTLNVQKFASF